MPEPDYSPLVADLRLLAKHLPPTAIPTWHELAAFAGAIAAYLEHGPAIVTAAREADHTTQAGADAIASVLVSRQPLPPTPNAGPEQAGFNQAMQAEVDQLRAQVAAMAGAAAAHASVATSEPVAASAPAGRDTGVQPDPIVTDNDAPPPVFVPLADRPEPPASVPDPAGVPASGSTSPGEAS